MLVSFDSKVTLVLEPNSLSNLDVILSIFGVNLIKSCCPPLMIITGACLLSLCSFGAHGFKSHPQHQDI